MLHETSVTQRQPNRKGGRVGCYGAAVLHFQRDVGAVLLLLMRFVRIGLPVLVSAEGGGGNGGGEG